MKKSGWFGRLHTILDPFWFADSSRNSYKREQKQGPTPNALGPFDWLLYSQAWSKQRVQHRAEPIKKGHQLLVEAQPIKRAQLNLGPFLILIGSCCVGPFFCSRLYKSQSKDPASWAWALFLLSLIHKSRAKWAQYRNRPNHPLLFIKSRNIHFC